MFEDVLADLLSVSGIRGVVVAGKDGLPLEAELVDKSLDQDLVAAMVAAAYGSGSTAVSNIIGGDTDIVCLEGTNGKIMMAAAKDAILAVVTDTNVNVGLVRVLLRKGIEKVEAVL